MPMLIQYIDKIAVQKQRDVLLVRFTKAPFVGNEEYPEPVEDWEKCSARQVFLQWCQDNSILATPCGPASNSGWIVGYFGDLYIDVPNEPDNADFHKLSDHLEHPDGRMKQPHDTFYLFPLDVAEHCQHKSQSGD